MGSNPSAWVAVHLCRIASHCQRTHTRARQQVTADCLRVLDLPPEQLEGYTQDGFLLFPSLLGQSTLVALRQTLDHVTMHSTSASHSDRDVEMEPEQPPTGAAVRRVYEPCTRYSAFHQLATSPLMLGFASQLFGACPARLYAA